MNDADTGNPTMFVIDDDAMPTELYECNDACVYFTKMQASLGRTQPLISRM